MAPSPIELRHKLHSNPELAYFEYSTTKTILESIEAIAGSKEVLKLHSPMNTGLLAEYRVNDGEYLLFRADIDALSIKEDTEYEYKSQNDYMHACGHDVHASVLYGLLKYVIENKVQKNILFFFQPAEESGGGAMKFFDTGVFDAFKIKNAFALHVTDEYPKGLIASSPGVLFASALEITLDLIGVSAHVAFPQNGKNALNALRIFLDSVDQLPKDISDPSIVGIGKISAGEVRNIIPGKARLEGSIRALSVEKANALFNKLDEILSGIEKITGVKPVFNRVVHYPEVVINKELYYKLAGILGEKYQVIDCSYKMTGEDFGFISRRYDSFMFWLGTSTGERHGLHNPKFLPDDSVVDIGISIMTDILENS